MTNVSRIERSQGFSKSLIAVLTVLAWTQHATAYDCSAGTYRTAHTKMDLAFKMGILESGGGITVLIDDGFWRTMTFREKEAFADALVCAVAGEGKGLMSLGFRSKMTGKSIAEWKLGTLTVY